MAHGKKAKAAKAAKPKGGKGHSYVSKDKGDAKAKQYKMIVAEWLHEDAPDAELLICLTRLSELNLWKEFAQTLGRCAHAAA